MPTTGADQGVLKELSDKGQLASRINGQVFPDIPKVLPHEKVFPIQIGSKLFRLSGASISSDGKRTCPQVKDLIVEIDANLLALSSIVLLSIL
jgi:hypothetical protein